jgi:hypothetical protein
MTEDTQRIEALAKDLVLAHREGRRKAQIVSMDSHPMPGEYVLTGIQAGNIHGEKGWRKYVGYVVQVRLKAGAYGTDMIFLRQPDGGLMTHENQCYFRPVGEFLDEVKAIFPADVTPELCEDYSQEYSIGGKFPRRGSIVQPEDAPYSSYPGPLVQITVLMTDGSKTVEIL